jgi:hypothetical protein
MQRQGECEKNLPSRKIWKKPERGAVSRLEGSGLTQEVSHFLCIHDQAEVDTDGAAPHLRTSALNLGISRL